MYSFSSLGQFLFSNHLTNVSVLLLLFTDLAELSSLQRAQWDNWRYQGSHFFYNDQAIIMDRGYARVTFVWTFSACLVAWTERGITSSIHHPAHVWDVWCSCRGEQNAAVVMPVHFILVAKATMWHWQASIECLPKLQSNRFDQPRAYHHC